jgi:hypothetical protein
MCMVLIGRIQSEAYLGFAFFLAVRSSCTFLKNRYRITYLLPCLLETLALIWLVSGLMLH